MNVKRALLSSITVLSLSACAMSPGMYMGDPEKALQQLQNDESLQEGGIPIGNLITINAEFIKEQRMKQPIVYDISHLYGQASAYRVGPGDILNIIVWAHPELSLGGAAATAASTADSASIDGGNIGTGYNVSRDGRIQFPFAGAIRVAGLTELQIRNRLTNILATYITDPQLTVQIREYRNSRIYLDGEVNTPGLQSLNDIPMTLPEALNRAGGLTENADRSSIILTRQGQKTSINLTKLLAQGVDPNRIMLKNGDMLRINHRNKAKVFLFGEVLRPQALTMDDGELTLAQALGEVGGTSIHSNPEQIYIIRSGEEGKADIYHLNASSPTALMLANGFQLQPSDMIYVDPARVVRWNRVISNILPSYGAVVSTVSATD